MLNEKQKELLKRVARIEAAIDLLEENTLSIKELILLDLIVNKNSNYEKPKQNK